MSTVRRKVAAHKSQSAGAPVIDAAPHGADAARAGVTGAAETRAVPAEGSDRAERLHELLMDLIRATGLLQPDRIVPGQPVSLSQAFALHELDTETPLSQRDLARRLRLDKSTVSRLAADLQRRGLLVREREPGNRRLYRLRLTEAGRTLHARMAGGFHQQYTRWVAVMDPAERDALLVGLPALVRAMHSASAWHAGLPETGPPED